MTGTIAINKVKNYVMDDLKRQANDQALNDEIIGNDGFFPAISLLNVRNAMRLDGTITNERLKMAVIEAMATVNHNLKPYKDRIRSGNAFTLEELEDEQINGESITIQRYKRAVYCLACANLQERYRSYDSTKNGAEKAQEFENSVDDLRRDAFFAIRDILGKGRINVELI
ncbi:head completion/stabilization protein [Caviibacterium pharyngocola]|uniref:Phage head protein n=1 Tax=Caviibacterium pharyngocola TaxID=28159 RepID=A0A2M8RT92_9PAST|nr:head completion/stabilization protein [Caviibacterium pharyngocola]PJG82115.1 phage head protein [Caviibacterium pharyngocola]